MKKMSFIGLVIILLSIGYCSFRSRNLDNWNNIPLVSVKKSAFKVVLRQIGEVRSSATRDIFPESRGKLADLVPEGTRVSQDEPVAWMETEDLEKELSQKQVDLEIAKMRLQKALEDSRLDGKINLLNIRESEANVQYRKAQLDNAVAKLEKTVRLVESNLSPRKSLEEAELEKLSQELQYQNAQIAHEKAIDRQKTQIEMKKADVTTARIDVEKAQAEYDQAQKSVENAVIKAPTSGIVMYKKVWKGSGFDKVQVGDQVGPWQPILEIPDLTDMEVITPVDEIDISRVKTGMPATIHLDAFPDLLLTGKIKSISTLAQNTGNDRYWGPKQSQGSKVFEVVIGIDEKEDRLRPGITGNVEILLDSLKDVLSVPIESVFTSENRSIVYGLGLRSFKEIEVTTGPRNYHDVVISSGLSEGQKVFLADPNIQREDN